MSGTLQTRDGVALPTEVVVEREVPGECFRLMVANGSFLYAVRRRPRSLVGDGSHSIADLERYRDDCLMAVQEAIRVTKLQHGISPDE